MSSETRTPEFPWDQVTQGFENVPDDYRNLMTEIFSTGEHFFLNPVFNVFVTNDEHWNDSTDLHDPGNLLEGNITQRIKSIDITEQMNKKSDFTIELLDYRPLGSVNRYNFTDSYLFSPGRFVTIQLGYHFGSPGANYKYPPDATGDHRRGMFVRTICYKWIIEDVSPDFGVDGAPTVRITGTCPYDIAFSSLQISEMNIANLPDFLRNLALKFEYPTEYDNVQDGSLPETIFDDPDFPSGEHKIPIVTGTETYAELFKKIAEYQNYKIFVDSRTNVMWAEPQKVGERPNIFIQQGDSWVDLGTGETYIHLLDKKILGYKTGLTSDIIQGNVIHAEWLFPRKGSAGDLGYDAIEAEEPNYKMQRGDPENLEDEDETLSSYEEMKPVVDKALSPTKAAELEDDEQYKDQVEEGRFTDNEVNLRKLVQSYTDHAQWNIELQVHTLGDPTVRPGIIVFVLGVGERLSGDYEVTAVRHSYNADGYKQVLSLKTNTVKQVQEEDRDDEFPVDGGSAGGDYSEDFYDMVD